MLTTCTRLFSAASGFSGFFSFSSPRPTATSCFGSMWKFSTRNPATLIRQNEVIGIGALGVGVTGDEEHRAFELFIAQRGAELLQDWQSLRRDLSRVEIEEHFEVDCRQVVLFDHVGDFFPLLACRPGLYGKV